MDLAPLFLLWLFQKGGGKAAQPVWPHPPPGPPAPAAPGAAPGKRPGLRPLPDASWHPHPAPIPMHVIEVAQSFLRSLPYGDWKQDAAVIYRKEDHGAGRTGITAYVQR